MGCTLISMLKPPPPPLKYVHTSVCDLTHTRILSRMHRTTMSGPQTGTECHWSHFVTVWKHLAELIVQFLGDQVFTLHCCWFWPLILWGLKRGLGVVTLTMRVYPILCLFWSLHFLCSNLQNSDDVQYTTLITRIHSHRHRYCWQSETPFTVFGLFVFVLLLIYHRLWSIALYLQ